MEVPEIRASSDRHGANAANTTIVLVHGAWADGTNWQEIIPLLQKESYKVVAVQNPLSSLAADVETTKRLIDRETGSGRDVVAVAHRSTQCLVRHARADTSD